MSEKVYIYEEKDNFGILKKNYGYFYLVIENLNIFT